MKTLKNAATIYSTLNRLDSFTKIKTLFKKEPKFPIQYFFNVGLLRFNF